MILMRWLGVPRVDRARRRPRPAPARRRRPAAGGSTRCVSSACQRSSTGFSSGSAARPLVRPLQPRPGRQRGSRRNGGRLGADIDLLAPVALAARMFLTGAVVAAEMRRVDHLDGELVGLRQGEELPARHAETSSISD